MSGGALPGRPLPGNRWDLLDGIVPDRPVTVSVIVAHYDQQAELDRTLHALARQTHPAELTEVIVVDDGSPRAPEVASGVTLVLQDDLGFRLAAARNAGARAATGEILLFLDADTAPEPRYVERMLRLPALAPDVVCVARRRHADFSGEPVDAAVEHIGPAHELAEPGWLREGYRVSRNLLDADDRSYRYVIGAVIACHRELFAAAGDFDESFTEYGGEDWEWAHRAWLAGAVLAHEPLAVAWHDGPEWADRDTAGGDAHVRDAAGGDRPGGDDDAEHRRRKSAEALRLAQRISTPGSGTRGIRQSRPDIVLRLPDAQLTAAHEFITVDSLLADLPLAAVISGPHATHAPDAAHAARIRVDVHRAVRVQPGAVRDAVAELDAGQLGRVELTNAHGAALISVVAVRAETRERRWGVPLFEERSHVTDGIRDLQDTPEPDVEAYLGGWGG